MNWIYLLQEEEMEVCINLNTRNLKNSMAERTMAESFDLRIAYHQISSGGRLGANTVDTVRNHVVVPACRFLSETLDCLKPYNDQVKRQCGQEATEIVIFVEYLEQFVDSTCPNNGLRAVGRYKY